MLLLFFGGLPPVTGTSAAVEGDDTSAASGSLLYTGTAAPTEGNDTSSISAQVRVSGTSATTEAADTTGGGGATQYARPNGVVGGVGGWTDENGLTSNLHLTIDESSFNDSDYIQSTTVVDVIEFSLSSVSDPNSSSGHIFRIRGAETNLSLGFQAELRQGSSTSIVVYTDIANGSFTPTTDPRTLSGAEADTITDYTDLRLRITGDASSVGILNTQVTWFELEVPGAVAGATGVVNNRATVAVTEADDLAGTVSYSLPTYQNSGAFNESTGTVIFALPASLSTNDLLLLFIETAGGQTATITNPNGGTWTEVSVSPQESGSTVATDTRLTVFWSRYNGTQGSVTLNDPGDHICGHIHCIRGATLQDPPFNVVSGGSEGSDTSVSINGLTTTLPNTLVVVGFAHSTTSAFAAGLANTDLANFTQRTNNSSLSGNDGSLTIATGEKAVAGTVGSTSATLNTAATKAYISLAVTGTSTVSTTGATGEVTATTYTGTVAVTEANDTSTASGIVLVTGTIAVTEAADTSSITAIAQLTGTIAVTEAADTSSITALITVAGTVAVTEAADTSSITGTRSFQGTIAVTEAADTSNASGTITVTGTIAVTEAADTSNIAGTVRVQGSIAVTEAPDTSNVSGSIIVTGSVAVTEAADTSNASGSVAGLNITGTIAVTEAADVSNISGTYGYAGTVAVTEANDTSSIAALVRVIGSIAVTEASDVSSITGIVRVTGTIGVTEAADTSTASGTVQFIAFSTTTEANDTANISGIVRVLGTIAYTESADTGAASGVVFTPVTGTISVTEAPDVAVITGTVPVQGGAASTHRRKLRTKLRTSPKWDIWSTATIKVRRSDPTPTWAPAPVANSVQVLEEALRVKYAIRAQDSSAELSMLEHNTRNVLTRTVRAQVRRPGEDEGTHVLRTQLSFSYPDVRFKVNLQSKESFESDQVIRAYASDPLLEDVTLFIASIPSEIKLEGEEEEVV